MTSLGEFCSHAALPEAAIDFIRVMWDEDDDVSHNIVSIVQPIFERQTSKYAASQLVLREEDVQIHTLLEFLRLNFSDPLASLGSKQKRQSLLSAMADLVPRKRKTAETFIFTEAENAFAIAERKDHMAEQMPSTGILHEIMDRHGRYQEEPMGYMAPYTAIVGPSGVGKSFVMKQVAVKHGVYVLYVNVRTDKGPGYPVKSTIEVPLQGRRENLEQQWDQFLRFYLDMVQRARGTGITASGLFTLTMDQKYAGFGKDLTALAKGKGDRTDAIQALLAKYLQLLEENGDNGASVDSPGVNVPVIVCFDEARALLQFTEEGEATSFRALRTAAKLLSSKMPENLAKFFIVMMDTTSKISNFAPTRIRDPSQKMRQLSLLEPIWRIDSWSVFAQARMPEPDGGDDAVAELFRLGRPLWGAFLETGCTVKDVVGLATEKLGFDKLTGKTNDSVTEESNVRDLALLSTRVNFYIGQASLAERLVSGYLRYVVTITKDRDGLVSTQPREPLLAYAASRILQDLQIRHAAIRTWMSHVAGGSVNPGDIGEQVSILMLLFASDDAMRPLETLPGPVPLSRFWQTLFGSDSWDGLEKSMRKGALKDGRVFFNHFVRLSSRPSETIIHEAYCRGQALILPENCPGIDLIIPIQVGGGEESKMGALLVQVKNRASDKLTGSTREYFKSCFKTGLAALPLQAPLPGGYIGLAMCLRCEPGREEYHLSDPAAFKKNAVDFPVAIALGIGVYALHGNGSLEEKGITEIFCRVVQRWPDLYPESDLKIPYVDRLIYPFNSFA